MVGEAVPASCESIVLMKVFARDGAVFGEAFLDVVEME